MTSSDHHRKLDEFGEGKCSVPMWCQGLPAGFCDAPAYGERPPCREFRAAYTGKLMRMDGKYNGYVPGLACHSHGGPKSKVRLDGSAYCATMPGFVNLQESVAGFGDTPDLARTNLENAMLTARQASKGGDK